MRDDYARLIREMKLNRVDEIQVGRRETNVSQKLNEIIENNFEQTRRALGDFRTTLVSPEPDLGKKIGNARPAGDEAKKQMRTLIERLEKVLKAMEGINDINKIITLMKDLDERERKEYERLKRLYNQKWDDIMRELGATDPPKQKKP